MCAVAISGACLESGPLFERGAADPATRRTPPAGDIVGYSDATGAHSWRGIPFAQAPVGELRWRAPRTLPRWEGTREALELGSACVQPAVPILRSVEASLGEAVGSEDCLFLNIHAPKDALAKGALPVMVWIHGGANAYGEGGAWDLAALAETRDVIVVTTNYRLGILGWFSHPALRNEDDSALDRSGNYGTLDLVQSLEWVRDNIAAFGGDPSNVTLFGSSAGGSNILALMLTPQSEGLFHGAVAMSGGVWSTAEPKMQAWREDDGTRWSSLEVLAALRLASDEDADRDAAKVSIDALPPAAIESALRGASSAALLEAVPPTEWGRVAASVEDGHVLPRSGFLEAYADGRFHRVPLVAGSCRDEAKFFMAMSPGSLWQYVSDESSYHRDAEYDSNLWKASAVDEVAIAMGSAGHRDVWAYRFDWDDLPPRYGFSFHKLLGAFHGVLGPFLLGPTAPNASWIPSDTNSEEVARLSGQATSYWTQFAATGDPGRGRAGDLPEWRRWSSAPDDERLLVLDSQADGATRMTRDLVTIASLLETLAADPRFDDDDERCTVYNRLASQTEVSGAGLPELEGCEFATPNL